MIKAKIVADSLSPQGDRLTSLLITFPRIILSELNTHRALSKNTSSSRAIPFNKMVEAVQRDPFIPIAWQKDHKGMQGSEYWGKEDWVIDQPNVSQINVHNCAIGNWLQARDNAVSLAKQLSSKNITKQLCNRLLEPFMWTTMLITATEFENFFKLRCPNYKDDVVIVEDNRTTSTVKIQARSKKEFISKLLKNSMYTYTSLSDLDWLEINTSQAEIHMQALAEAIYDAMNESTPKRLNPGEWHIPFGDKMNEISILTIVDNYNISDMQNDLIEKAKIKIATARCARLSYMTFDGEIDYEKDIALHDRLLADGHMSPFEHCARAMTDYEYESFIKGKLVFIDEIEDYCIEEPLYKYKGWCNNYCGFIQYRYMIDNGTSI